MDRKKSAKAEVIKQYGDLDEMLGNGNILSCFPDGIERKLTLIPLVYFSKFMANVMIINVETLWTNFLQENTEEAIKTVIGMSFVDSEDIMNVINAKNFPIIMGKILDFNDIKLGGKDDNPDETEKKRT